MFCGIPSNIAYMQHDLQNKKLQSSREDLIFFFFFLHSFLLHGIPIIATEIKEKKKRKKMLTAFDCFAFNSFQLYLKTAW